MNKHDIAHYSAGEQLRDGRSVTIRAIRPEDKGHIAEQVKSLSPETVYLRTFAPKRALDDRDLKRMTEVDFEKVVALVVVAAEGGQEMIVGGGRYFLIDASSAEVAFLIGDRYQGIGIGSRIFRHLVSIARASGITKFEAEVLPTNEGMLRLFDRSGLPVKKTAARDAVHVTIDLAAEPKRQRN